MHQPGTPGPDPLGWDRKASGEEPVGVGGEVEGEAQDISGESKGTDLGSNPSFHYTPENLAEGTWFL